MKKSLFSLLMLLSASALSLLLSSCSEQIISQRSFTLTDCPATLAGSINLEEYSRKYKGNDCVYLDNEMTIEHTANLILDKEPMAIALLNMLNSADNALWWYHGISRRKYLILNPDNPALNTFSLQVGKHAVINGLYLRISSPGEPVKNFGIADLQKEYNSGGEVTYKFIYSGVKKGTIIEEAYDLSYDVFKTPFPVAEEKPLQFEFPCEKLSFKLAYPSWWEVKVKKLSGFTSLNYTFSNDLMNHRRIINYKAENVPCIKNEDFSPGFKEMGKYLEFMATKFVVGPYSQSLSGSWPKLGEYLKSVLEDDERKEEKGPVDFFARNLTFRCTRQLEKLDKIITYLQNNIEIQSSGNNDSFESILNNKKGTELRIAGLAQYMLSRAGLESDVVIIHSEANGYFDPDFVTLRQMTYTAVRTIIDNKEYIAFPAIKGLPVDYKMDEILGQHALLVPIKGNAEIIKLSDSSQCGNSLTENFDLQIDESGAIRVKDEKLIKGYLAFKLRNDLWEMADEKKESYLKDLLTFEGGGIKISNYEIENLDESMKPLKITLDYTIDNLVTVTPEEIVFQTRGLLSPVSFAGNDLDTAGRVNPVEINFGESIVRNIKLNFPKDWMLFTRVANMEYSNDFGRINVVYETSEGGLKIVQSHSLKRSSGPKEKIGELCQLISSKSRFNLPAIAFRRN